MTTNEETRAEKYKCRALGSVPCHVAAKAADYKANNERLNRQRHPYRKACITGSWNVRELTLENFLKLVTLRHILESCVCSGEPRLPL